MAIRSSLFGAPIPCGLGHEQERDPGVGGHPSPAPGLALPLSVVETPSMLDAASQLLARGLHQQDEPAPQPFSWVSGDLGRPAVDLEDKDALNALLDR